MTKSQKIAVRNIAVLITVKIVISVAVHYGTKALIKKLDS